jgi:N-acetylneuraminic acid mutarotase
MRPYYTQAFSLIVLSAFISCTPKTNLSDQSGNWAFENELNGPARSEAVSFVIGNEVYIGTGWNGLTTRFADFWKYDQVNNSWIQINNMPGLARSSAVAFSVGQKAYVGTGFDGANILSDFYELDTEGNVWAKKSDFPGGSRYEAVAFSIGNLGYAGTGFDGNSALKDFYQYDPAADAWTEIGFSGNKRYGAAVFTYQNAAYLVTGVNNGVMQADFWKFDPAAQTQKWTERRKISNLSNEAYDDGYTTIERWNAAAFVIPPFAYLSTGENVGYNSNTWQYDFSQDIWTVKTPFEGPAVTGAVGYSLYSTTGGGGFISTGRSAGGQAGSSDFVWEFFPDQTKNPNDNN